MVFVVDDEQVIADTVAAILRMSGFTAESFYDGISALNRAHETEPDVLISDVLMPGMDGLTLAYKVRQACPSCRIILFSGNTGALEGNGEFAEYRRRLNIVGVLTKPMYPSNLIAHVRWLLSGQPN